MLSDVSVDNQLEAGRFSFEFQLVRGFGSEIRCFLNLRRVTLGCVEVTLSAQIGQQ